MKKLGVSLVATLFVLVAAQQAMAAKAAKPKADKPHGPAPVAKADAISEIRGDYKWGMTPQQVMDKINARIEEGYKDRIAKSAADPAKNDKLRKQMHDETAVIKKNQVKFDGRKGPWDVSIIDQEIVRNQPATSSSTTTACSRCSSPSTRRCWKGRNSRTSARPCRESSARRKRST